MISVSCYIKTSALVLQNKKVILRSWLKASTFSSAKKRKIDRKLPRELALEYFDSHYSHIYGDSWKNIRTAMLSAKKHCALVNFFTEDLLNVESNLVEMGALAIAALKEPEKVVVVEERESAIKVPFDDSQRTMMPGSADTEVMCSFIPATEFISQEDSDDTQKIDSRILVQQGASPILWPETIRAFAFPPASSRKFPAPKRTSDSLMEYYPMDACSLLPVIALQLQPGDVVLDACAAPGGKTIAMAFTQCPERIHCNDVSRSRMQRLRYSLDNYVPKSGDVTEFSFSTREIQRFLQNESCMFDKILLDVPCTNDRHSLQDDENNWFHPKRKSERFEVPKLQAEMLKLCLKHLSIGGALVYSTCSLSPWQNDSVVHMALASYFNTDRLFAVCDLSSTWKLPTGWFFPHPGTSKYGQTFVPDVKHNFGPMYIARVERIR